MSATEKIGTTELSTSGLRLARLDGNVNLPPFKNILPVHDFESNLLVLDENTVEIKLIGFYASKAALGAAINNFHTKIKSALKHIWTFTNHDFAETCVVKDGMSCIVTGKAVEILLKLRITE